MGFLEKYFHIVTTRNCPLYDTGNRFKLSGIGFECLEKKPVCLFLAKTISEIAVFSLDEAKPSVKPKPGNQEYNCPGCSGFIKFSAEDDKHYATPHMQMLAAAERRKQMDQMGSIINLLSSFSFFQALEEDSLKEIISCTTLRKYQPGQTVLLRGQNGTSMFIIVAGKVALISQKGEDFAYLGNGEIFGEMSLLSGKPVSVTIKAVETLKVLVISGKDLQQILIKYPFLQSAFTKLLVQRLAASNTKKSLPSSGIGGQLNEISAAELFQMFHENMKSGKIDLQLGRGKAKVIFQDGEIVMAHYRTLNGIEAFNAILKENNGTFQYSALSSQEETGEMRPIGGFMKLLMEGLQQIDEENASK
jgi:CRP/FNR family cyclic AMP-dependent transcriptional regulator